MVADIRVDAEYGLCCRNPVEPSWSAGAGVEAGLGLLAGFTAMLSSKRIENNLKFSKLHKRIYGANKRKGTERESLDFEGKVFKHIRGCMGMDED